MFLFLTVLRYFVVDVNYGYGSHCDELNIICCDELRTLYELIQMYMIRYVDCLIVGTRIL